MRPMNQPAALGAAMLARFPFLQKLRGLPRPLLMAGAATLAAAVAALALWSRGPDYRVLYASLDERDGGAIVAALGQMNVPYRFADQGGALMVPADRVHEVRLQLAGQGLPRGGSAGFELLDDARFGASQFAEQVNYQRALEGELARSVETLHGVRHARIHLALPRQSLFVRERQAPTASVVLELYPGRSLGDSQVSAIAWLVSSSVPELAAENVSVVDQNGRLLSAPAGRGTGMDADQLRYVRELEQRTVERILTLLNPLLGPGNVHAQASADVDFSQRERTSEVYAPNQSPGREAVRSKQTSDSRQRGANPPEGVPGALTNQPPADAAAPVVEPPAANAQAPAAQAGQPAPQAPAGDGRERPSSSRSDATINYELDRTIDHIKEAPGMLRRLSVAVAVNYRPDENGEMQPLPPAELDKLDGLVREAMGYSKSRGDSLSLANARFSDAEPQLPYWRRPEAIELGKSLLGYLAAALALLWFWRRIGRPAAQRLLAPAPEAPGVEEDREQARREAEAQARARTIGRYEDNLETARKLAEKDPRAVAMVLRSWIEKDGK